MSKTKFVVFAKFMIPLALSGCISSVEPVLEPESSAIATLKTGFYESCRVNQSGAPDCQNAEVVYIAAEPGYSRLLMQSSADTKPNIITLNKINGDLFSVQIVHQVSQNDQSVRRIIRYGLATISTEMRGFHVWTPKCQLDSPVLQSWAQTIGTTIKSSSEDCKFNKISKAELTSLLVAFHKDERERTTLQQSLEQRLYRPITEAQGERVWGTVKN